MYKVTERRMNEAQHILNNYNQKLEENGSFCPGILEQELKQVWGTGFKEIKSAMVDLYKNNGGKHGRVAEYYMRNQAPENMMVSQFKNALGVH